MSTIGNDHVQRLVGTSTPTVPITPMKPVPMDLIDIALSIEREFGSSIKNSLLFMVRYTR
jgi:hypothetical protein